MLPSRYHNLRPKSLLLSQVFQISLAVWRGRGRKLKLGVAETVNSHGYQDPVVFVQPILWIILSVSIRTRTWEATAEGGYHWWDGNRASFLSTGQSIFTCKWISNTAQEGWTNLAVQSDKSMQKPSWQYCFLQSHLFCKDRCFMKTQRLGKLSLSHPFLMNEYEV